MIVFDKDVPDHAPNSQRLVRQPFPSDQELRDAMATFLPESLSQLREHFNMIPAHDVEALDKHPYMAFRVMYAWVYGRGSSV